MTQSVKHTFITLCFLFIGSYSFGQKDSIIKYYPATNFTLVGKILETKLPYQRVDTLINSNLPANVKKRLTRSAGLAISFKTNSKSISAKWCTDSQYPSTGMTSIAFRGLDLYIKRDGKWQFAGVGSPQNGKWCSKDKIVQNLPEGEHECLLYLPVYSDTKELEIGIDEGASISAGSQPFNKRILVYGSSIVQGASASRPGMIYTSRLSRETGYNFLNLGMAGVAKMEKEVADMVAGFEADAYLLDCIPNSSPKEVSQRAEYLITEIRKKHANAPIIFMQSVIREGGNFNQKVAEKVANQNKNIAVIIEKLKNNGFKNLHFITAEDFLGNDHEATTDGTHPNDLGFDRMIKVIKPKIVSIIN